MDISVSVAVVDFIPVLLFFVATFILRRDLYRKMSVSSFTMFATGTLFVFFAGFFKALYKLLYALGVCDFQALSTMFFPTQSIGFIVAGVGILTAVLGKKKGATLAAVPPLFSGTFVFVGLMVAGIFSVGAGLCVYAKRLGKGKLAIFFLLQCLCCTCMGYLSSRDFTQSFMNWLAEGINIVGQTAFLIGSVKLHKAGLGDM